LEHFRGSAVSIEAASGEMAVSGGTGAPRAAARAGMSFRAIVGTALAALLLCGVGLAAPAAGGAGGERPLDTGAGNDDAAGLEDELGVGAAELAAVPAESRAVLAKVLGRLEGLRGELEELKAGKLELEARVAELEEKEECEDKGEEEKEKAGATTSLNRRVTALKLEQAERRRVQGAEPEPEPEVGYVHLIKREATTGCDESRCTPGATTVDGTFDYSICQNPALACCYREACGGHRRRCAQANGYGNGERTPCDASDLPARPDAVNYECCDEAGEDCTGGYPRSCNAGCAVVFLPFWEGCRSALGKDSRSLEPVVALCEAVAPAASTGGSLAEQMSVQCTKTASLNVVQARMAGFCCSTWTVWKQSSAAAWLPLRTQEICKGPVPRGSG
jgi:hypothetical protein